MKKYNYKSEIENEKKMDGREHGVMPSITLRYT